MGEGGEGWLWWAGAHARAARARTAASRLMSSSEAPKLASPISWEKSAKSGSANMGTWPSSSWHTSGSGVYSGTEWCRMYCVEKNTRNARPFKKSRAESRPPTGRTRKPVQLSRNAEMSCSCGTWSGA